MRLRSLVSVLVRVSIAIKRKHEHNNSYKGKPLVGAGLQFQRFSPLIIMVRSMAARTQGDIVLEKEPRALHLDIQTAEGDCVLHWAELEHIKPES